MQHCNFILHFIYVVWKYAYENLKKLELNVPTAILDLNS